MPVYRPGLEEEQQPPTRNPAAQTPGGESAAQVGKWAIRLAAWGTLTVGVTLFVLRPAGRAAGANGAGDEGGRGGLSLGSGVIGLALKTNSLLSEDQPKSSPTPTTKPAAAPVVPAKAKPKSAKPAKGTIKVTGTAMGATTLAPNQPAIVKPAVIDGDKNPFARDPRPTSPAQATHAAPKPAPVVRRTPEQVASVEQPRGHSQPPSPSQPQRATPAPEIKLGSLYQDRATGYSMQFPAGWTHKAVKGGGGWVLDATDGRGGVISIGFAPFPANVTAEQVSPERIATALRARPGTVVHGGGFGQVGGRKCLWHKYTGPIPRPDGDTRMTAVHYLLPLGDGRALELRLASTPDKFNELAPRMKQSVNSFRIVSPQKAVRVAAVQKKSA